MTAGPLLVVSPRGDGHTVIVLPGLGGDDASTAPLRWFLTRLGYRAIGWGLGRNVGFGRRVAGGLDELLADASVAGRPASLVGWSLGGVHAFEAARRRPHGVRTIVTLGSPLAGRRPPAGLPTTSIYSQTDGSSRGGRRCCRTRHATRASRSPAVTSASGTTRASR